MADFLVISECVSRCLTPWSPFSTVDLNKLHFDQPVPGNTGVKVIGETLTQVAIPIAGSNRKAHLWLGWMPQRTSCTRSRSIVGWPPVVVEVSQAQYIDRIVDVTVVLHRQAYFEDCQMATAEAVGAEVHGGFMRSTGTTLSVILVLASSLSNVLV